MFEIGSITKFHMYWKSEYYGTRFRLSGVIRSMEDLLYKDLLYKYQQYSIKKFIDNGELHHYVIENGLVSQCVDLPEAWIIHDIDQFKYHLCVLRQKHTQVPKAEKNYGIEDHQEERGSGTGFLTRSREAEGDHHQVGARH